MAGPNNSMITNLNDIHVDKNNSKIDELDDPEIKNLLKKLDRNDDNDEDISIPYNQQNNDLQKNKIQQEELENIRFELEQQKRINEDSYIQKEMEKKSEFNDFEEEMDNLIGTSNNTQKLSPIKENIEKKILNKKTIVKCIIIIIISFLITNSKILLVFQKIIPENIYNKLHNNQSIIYYIILFIVLYLLYYFNYI